MDQKQNRVIERIEGDRIILDGSGKFPKEILVLKKDKSGIIREKITRILRKTAKGGFLLN